MTKPNLNFFMHFDGGYQFRTIQGLDLTVQVAREIEAVETRERARSNDEKKRFRSILRTVLANLFAAYRQDPMLFVGISRRHGEKKPLHRYSYNSPNPKMLVSVLDGLAHPEIGLIEQYKGTRDTRGPKEKLNRTKIKATGRLINQFEKAFQGVPLPVRFFRGETIRLKDDTKKKALIDYKDTEQTNQWRENVRAINDILQLHHIDIYLNPEQHLDLKAALKRKGETPAIDFARKQLHRVFSNNTFNQNGRFYGGWWANIPSRYRSFIRIDGHRVVEFDYSGMSLNALYSREGETPPEGDAYELDGYDAEIYRDSIKLIFQKLLNAKDKTIGSKGINLPKGKKLENVVDDLAAKHKPIAKHFRTGVGMELMKTDSIIAERILLEFADEGIPLLPVHDSFLVRARHNQKLVASMMRAYRDVIGRDPGIKLEESWESQIHIKKYSEKAQKTGVIGLDEPALRQDVLANKERETYSGYYKRYEEWFQWASEDRNRMIALLESVGGKDSGAKFSDSSDDVVMETFRNQFGEHKVL